MVKYLLGVYDHIPDEPPPDPEPDPGEIPPGVGTGAVVTNSTLTAPATIPVTNAPSGWTRRKFDDFRNGTGVGTRWNAEYLHHARFLNDEIQYYVDTVNQPGFGSDFGADQTFTVHTDGTGKTWLQITARLIPVARRPSFQNRTYTSGVISNWGFNGNQTYGYWEAKVMYPNIKGIWPAFWTLTFDARWPPEIDGLEWPNNQTESAPNKYFTNLHWRDFRRASGRNASGGWNTVPGNIVTGAYISFLWTQQFIAYYCNGILFRTTTNLQPTAANPELGNHIPNHIAINLAIGGNWATTPNSANFPASILVTDYSQWEMPT